MPPYEGSLGNAVDSFLRRAAEIAADGGGETQLILPDWNLDSDRGYGFQCWEVVGGELEPPPVSGTPPVPSDVLIKQLP